MVSTMSEPRWIIKARYEGYCEHGVLLSDRCPECEWEMYIDMTGIEKKEPEDDPDE